VVDGFLALGTESAVRGVIDARELDVSLGDTQRYERATELLVEDRIALLFVDGEGLLRGIPGGASPTSGLFSNLLDAPGGTVAATVYAREDAVVIESVARVGDRSEDGTKGNEMLSTLPSTSWAGVQISDLGGRLRETIGALVSAGGPLAGPAVIAGLEAETGIDLQDDLLSWMGDAALFVEGDSPETLGGGVLIDSNSPDASAEAINRIHGLLLGRFDLPLGPVDLVTDDGLPAPRGFAKKITGFSLSEKGSTPINVISEGERVSITYGSRATYHSLEVTEVERLGERPRLEEMAGSLGSGFSTQGFVSVPELLKSVDATGASFNSAYGDELAENLEQISWVVFGSRTADGVSTRRVVIQAR